MGQTYFLFIDNSKTHHVCVSYCHLFLHLNPTYWVVDFRVVSMLLPHLLIMLLLFPPFILIKCFQVFASVVLFHHFIPLELIVSLFVVVLQIFSGLKARTKTQVENQGCPGGRLNSTCAGHFIRYTCTV